MGYLDAIQQIINGNKGPVFGATNTGNNFASKFAFGSQELEEDPLNKQLKNQQAAAGATAARNANMSAASAGYGGTSFATEAANAQASSAQNPYTDAMAKNAESLRGQGLQAAEAGLNIDNSIYNSQMSKTEKDNELLANGAIQDENHSGDFASSLMKILTGVGTAALPGGGTMFGGAANALLGLFGGGKK